MSCFELARAAVTALRAHVEEGGEPKRHYKIDTHLVVRESTGFPRGTMLHLRKRSKNAEPTPAAQAKIVTKTDVIGKSK
jgi:LacI family transcriptional regulator